RRHRDLCDLRDLGLRDGIDGDDRQRRGPAVDRRHTRQPERRQGTDAAVHRHWHLFRSVHPEPHQPGDLGFRDSLGSHHHPRPTPRAALPTAVATGPSAITATLGSMTGSTVMTVSAAVLQSIAVTPANPSVPIGGTQQFTATGTYTDQSTQNLTSQVTWASAT